MEAVIEFIKILVPASVVLFGAFWIVKMFIAKEIELKQLDVRGKSIETVLPSRLQAYERMTLFLERMSPQNLLVRINTQTMPASEFHYLLLHEIRSEYNHNVAQQLYMSETVWEQIKNAKEDLIVTINDAAGEMKPESTSLDLSKKIFEKSINKNIDPLAHALSDLKKEIQKAF